MLSLKKAASGENGWLFSEMTTARRVDETNSMHAMSDNRIRHSLDRYRGWKGPGSLRMEGSIDVPEEIGMVVARDLGDWQGLCTGPGVRRNGDGVSTRPQSLG